MYRGIRHEWSIVIVKNNLGTYLTQNYVLYLINLDTFLTQIYLLYLISVDTK